MDKFRNNEDGIGIGEMCSQDSDSSCRDIFEDSDEDILENNEPTPSRIFDDGKSLQSDNYEGEPRTKVAKLENKTVEEKQLIKTLAKLRNESESGVRHFGQYMQLKKDKLRYQVNVVSKADKTAVIGSIFEGISIFVNGHTDPSGLELRELIQRYGGEYHTYMEYGKTTFCLATSLASAKIDKTKKSEIYILPGWIVDCIAAGKLLPIDEYRLIDEEKEDSISRNSSISRFFRKNAVLKESEKMLDVKDPNFIQNYYARSRLHLISTIAQEMKDYTLSLYEAGLFSEEELIKSNLPRGQAVNEPVIFHIDIDSFFVSVAMRDRPDLWDKPVAITHSRGSASAPGFSEVASVSYAARNLGMKNGMLVRDALKLCPTLVCLPYQFDEYKAVSKSVYTLISKFGGEVRAVSCDEMYVNFSKNCIEKKINDMIGLANYIRARIKEESGGCPSSVGIGPSILLARLATRKAKPNGVYWVRRQNAIEFVANEKIENIPGIGHATIQKLKERFGEVEYCRDLLYVNYGEFETHFGKIAGKQIYQYIRGEDNSSIRNFMAPFERKSVSVYINYGIRFSFREEVLTFLGRVADEACRRLNSCRRVTGAVTVKLLIRSPDAPVEPAKFLGTGKCDSYTKTSLIKGNTDYPARLTKEIISLYDEISPAIEDLRGVFPQIINHYIPQIGVHCGRLVPSDGEVRRIQISKNFFDRRTISKLDQIEPRIELKSEKKIMPEIKEPTFNGIDSMQQVKLEMKAMFIEGYFFSVAYGVSEPNELNIRILSKFLLDLHEYRAYSTLRAYFLYLKHIVANSDVRSTWIEALYSIFTKLDRTMHWDWGGHILPFEQKPSFS